MSDLLIGEKNVTHKAAGHVIIGDRLVHISGKPVTITETLNLGRDVILFADDGTAYNVLAAQLLRVAK